MKCRRIPFRATRRIFLVVVAALAVLLFLGSHTWGIAHRLRGFPENLGNSPATVGRLGASEERSPYRFAVIGDPEDGVEVFEKCLRGAARRGCEFASLGGDIVHRARETSYRYFLYEFAETSYDRPVFTVIGNHDRRPDQDELFRHHFGSPNFHFVYQGDLFVLLDNTAGLSVEVRRWLGDLLGEIRPRVRRVFLFAHLPFVPFRKGGAGPEPPLPDVFQEIGDLVSRYRIDYLFTAHFHAYRRAALDGTVHVITGGGGGALQEPEAFHHFVEVEVLGDAVRDRVVRVDGPNLWERLEQTGERVLVRYVYLYFEGHPESYLFAFAIPVWWVWRRRRALRPDRTPRTGRAGAA